MENYFNIGTKTNEYELNKDLIEQLQLINDQWWRQAVSRGKTLLGFGDDAAKVGKGGSAAGKTASSASKLSSQAKSQLDDLLNSGKISKADYKIMGGEGAAVADDIINNYRQAIKVGYKSALPTPKFLRAILTANPQYVAGFWRWFRGMPLPPGKFKELRLIYGMGPACMAVASGLLKQYIVLSAVIWVIRTVLIMLESGGFTSIAPLNRIFGIEKYEKSPWGGGWVGDLIYNITMNAVYLPSAFVLLRGWKAVPWFVSNIKDIFSRINSIGSYHWGVGDDQTFEEAYGIEDPAGQLRSNERILNSELGKIRSETNEIPQDLLSKFPSNQRSKVKMNNDIVYFESPEYEIRRVRNEYVMLVPGDGWYRVQDLSYD